MDSLPDWTPGPGEYMLPTDFNKRTKEEVIVAEDDPDQEEIVNIVPSEKQKGFK